MTAPYLLFKVDTSMSTSVSIRNHHPKQICVGWSFETFDYSEDKDGFKGYIKLFPMLCTLSADSPDPSGREGVHDNLYWVPTDTLDGYPMLGADMATVKKIQLEYYNMCSFELMGNYGRQCCMATMDFFNGPFQQDSTGATECQVADHAFVYLDGLVFGAFNGTIRRLCAPSSQGIIHMLVC